MPTLYSMVNETGNRNRILDRCKIRFWLVHWIDLRSIEHNYACYIMKLCSRLLVLCRQNCLKDDKFKVIYPRFEEVRGGVEPWLMARWKALYDFLFVVIELFSLALTVEALQGKTCQDSLISGGGRSVWTKISGESVPGGNFLFSRKLDTFCYLIVQTTPCCVQSFRHNTGVWQTDGRTDGQRNCRS